MITKNSKIISEKELICSTFYSQARGLMFRRKQNLLMEFKNERKVNLHMFFVFFPIDVLVLNQNKEIVEIKRNFKPFTFWSSKKKGKFVVELAFPNNYKLGEKILCKKF
jgi:uncharacterized protein